MEGDLKNDLMDLLVLLNSDNEQDIKLGVGIFDAQYYNKGIVFPPEFKQGLKPKWKNFSLEYKRTITGKTSYKRRLSSIINGGFVVEIDEEKAYFIYLI